MKTSDFDYYLPEELIAQTPLKDRSTSRLLILDKSNKNIEHKHFYDIVDYLNKGDILVRNNTKVIPARIFGVKEETGAKVEVLLLKQIDDYYECLVGNAKVVKVGTTIKFSDKLKATCLAIKDEGIRHLKFECDGIFLEVLEEIGNMPLPPYIKETLLDKNRYQTIYAKYNGSAAAPTAGLHFTDEIFAKLKEKGVEVLDVTLHVGLGTFRPVKVDTLKSTRIISTIPAIRICRPRWEWQSLSPIRALIPSSTTQHIKRKKCSNVCKAFCQMRWCLTTSRRLRFAVI